MRRLAAFFAAAAVLAPSTGAAPEAPLIVTETIPMRFLKPSELVSRLAYPQWIAVDGPLTKGRAPEPPPTLVPSSVDQMSPDDVGMTLTVRGTARDIAEVRSIARLLDIRPRAVRLRMRLLRFRFPPEVGAPFVEELSVMTTEATNNVPVDLAAVGERRAFRLIVTPRINGDDSVTLFLEMMSPAFSEILPDKAPVGTIYRRVANNSRGLIPLRKEPDRTRPAMDLEWKGIVLPWSGAATELYVEVVPAVLPDAGDPKGKNP